MTCSMKKVCFQFGYYKVNFTWKFAQFHTYDASVSISTREVCVKQDELVLALSRFTHN